MNSLYNMFLFGGWDTREQSNSQANTSTEIMYLDHFLNITMTRFKWENLPETMEFKGWYIEKMLALYGCIALFKEPNSDKLVILRAMGVGQPTLFGEYTQYEVFGENGWTATINAEDCVVCWDNATHTASTGFALNSFASRVSDVQRTCDVRLKHHKAPVIMTGTQRVLASLKRFWKKIDNNEDHIIVTEGFDPLSNVGQVLYDANYINKQLQEYKQDLITEFYAMQGINYNPSDGKKERLIVNEVESNNEQILQSRMIHLEQRKQFCKEANEKFGLNIQCDYNLQQKDIDGKIDKTDDNIENNIEE